MNMRLLLPLIAALAFTPLLATHHGFGPNLRVGSGYASDWLLGAQGGAQGNATEQSVHFECVAAGADLLRRAAPPVIGGTAKSPWPHRSIGLAPRDQLVCVDS